MPRFFRRIPRWLTTTLSLAATAILTTAQFFTPALHGWAWKLTIGLLGVLAVLSGLLSQRQATQDSRLNVRLENEPIDLSIPAYQDNDQVITSMLAAEETECMASLAARLKRKGVRVYRADSVDVDAYGGKPGSGYQVKPGGTPVMAVLKLAEKKESGEDLTAEDEQILATSQEHIAKAMSSIVDMNRLWAQSSGPKRAPRSSIARKSSSTLLTTPSSFRSTFGGSTPSGRLACSS